MAEPHRAGSRGAARTRRLVVAALAGLAAATAVATAHVARAGSPKSAFPFADGKYFIVVCGASHRNDDDAIALPGQPGRSHNHTYAGNRSTDAGSTPESLRAKGIRTTCEPTADASAYWVPTLYARGRPVTPLVMLVYYVRRTAAVEPFPAGLKVIAGDSRATRPQPERVAYWTCGSAIGAKTRFPYVPSCAVSRGLNLTISFPDCWDGRRLDSADHKRHMAYSSGRRCPGSHPVSLPTMRLLVVYPAVRGGTIASGRYSAHGDFMNGWEQDFLGDRVRGLNH